MDLICYLSNGYKSIEESYKMAFEYVDSGCDVIEIDFPAKNPYLESEYIATRMKNALEKCNDYDKYIQSIIKLKTNLKNTRFIILAYEETVREIGVDKFIQFCIASKLEDIILVGLKDEKIKNKIIESGIKVSCYVQYQLLEEEIEYAKKSNGFVYFQAKPTNNVTHEKYKTLKECISYLRETLGNRKIYCGVGIKTPEDIKMVKEAGADAAFVGSSILKLQDDLPKMREMIGKLKDNCK